MDTSEHLTLAEVAALANCGRSSVRRAVMRGELHADKVEDVRGQGVWLVHRSTAEEWVRMRVSGQSLPTVRTPSSRPVQRQVPCTVRPGSSEDGVRTPDTSPDIPLQVHQAALELAREALADRRRAEEVLQVERDELERERRLRLAAQFEIQKFTRALAEHAESLHEQRTQVRYEALHEREQEVYELREELGQQDKELEELRVAKRSLEEKLARADRPWWRRMFGT